MAFPVVVSRSVVRVGQQVRLGQASDGMEVGGKGRRAYHGGSFMGHGSRSHGYVIPR